MEDAYKAQGECTNCGYENWPQWGTYKHGTQLTEYPCPHCGCLTWVPRGALREIDLDVGKTSESTTKN